MGNLKIKIALPFLLILLSACEKMEMRGFITSYENVNQRFEQSIEWNLQNPPLEINTSQQNYSIYSMGDSHVGGTHNLDQLFKDATDNEVKAVVMVGDLCTGHKTDYDEFSAHLPAKDALQYFAITGNHDLYFDGWQHFYSIFGSSTYFFTVHTPTASDLFICLDTGGATLGNKQLEWFKNLLETKRNNYRHCTVFTHNNLFRFRQTATANPFVEEMHVLLDLFTRHNVNMVVTAHDHKQNTDILGNTTHIIMDALEDSNDNASYLKLSITKKNIAYSFIELK